MNAQHAVETCTFEDAMVGEILTCPDCGVEFEIVSLDGGQVKLAAAENIKEDWGE
ncbi:MAG: hypothetical protein AMDU5_GPLC00017G0058 [Thermoplasmatales archaeon Gpl]|nr:MAG: hypothetical protein AMDU5_GPLC00017G0058 [Thermoplasmatales archaeon Gpl]